MPHRNSSREEEILHTAADLFAREGYTAVGMGAIGQAVGISGPAIYRYFKSKQSILEAICDRTMTRMLEGVTEIEREYAEPRLALEALVNLHVRFAVEERNMLGVWVREQRHLTPELRKDLRERRMEYQRPWRDVVKVLRPDLDEDEVWLSVYGVIALLNGSVVPNTPISPYRLETLLRRLALTALLVSRAPGLTSEQQPVAGTV